MQNHLITDLTNIVITYIDTETYKKLKNIYPEEFSNNKAEELNLFCNTPYDFLLRCAEEYSEAIRRVNFLFPKRKVRPDDLVVITSSDEINENDIHDLILENETIYTDPVFIDSLFYNNKKLRLKFDKYISYNNGDISNFMLQINEEILKNESDIYETDDPDDYMEIVEKYIIKKLKIKK
jgi:hypothetical protein